MLNYIVAMATIAALTFIITAAFFGTVREYRRFRNQKAAWTARQKIAGIAGRLENDPNTPAQIRAIAVYCADHAFDHAELQALFQASERVSQEAQAHAAQVSKNFTKQLKISYGERYASDALDLVKAFALLVMYEDSWAGARLRHSRRDLPTKDDAKKRVQPLWVSLCNHAGCAA